MILTALVEKLRQYNLPKIDGAWFAVVLLLAVQVVDVLALAKSPPEPLLHDVAMLKHLPPVWGEDLFVPSLSVSVLRV